MDNTIRITKFPFNYNEGKWLFNETRVDIGKSRENDIAKALLSIRNVWQAIIVDKVLSKLRELVKTKHSFH